MEPTEHSILTWGNHSGKTYGQTFHDHPDYIQWAVTTWNVGADSSPQLNRLVEWILKEEIRQATPETDFEMADTSDLEEDVP